jgi:hypothetical protein
MHFDEQNGYVRGRGFSRRPPEDSTPLPILYETGRAGLWQYAATRPCFWLRGYLKGDFSNSPLQD